MRHLTMRLSSRRHKAVSKSGQPIIRGKLTARPANFQNEGGGDAGY
jgi:hypothetical protein